MKWLPVFLFACLQLTAQAQQPVYPRYNQVYRMATHNSYWVRRSLAHELFASGAQQRLTDQLLFNQARALEIDIHKSRGHAGKWKVYHTAKLKNVLFEDFEGFLKQLQQFQYALPQHEVLTVVIELKEVLAHNFDKKHTPAQFDSLLEQYMGPWLFRPRNLMERCPCTGNLTECVQSRADIWPTTEELRGKVIFLVLGNFHVWPIGHGGEGWATYAVSDNPSAFPMSTDFSRFNVKGGERLPSEKLQKALNASVFRQVEELDDTANMQQARRFIAQGGIVRGRDSYTLAEQQKRVAAGFHMLQTDYPWVYLNDKGYRQPLHVFDTATYNNPQVLQEPGNCILLNNGDSVYKTFYTNPDTTYWETLPSSTIVSPKPEYFNAAQADGMGCIYAFADSLNKISLCRSVNSKRQVVVTVLATVKGITNTYTHKGNNHTTGTVGDYLQMRLIRTAGGCKAQLFSSVYTQRNGSLLTPQWNLLQQVNFDTYLYSQGLRGAGGQVLFTGTKRNGADVHW
jgi:hypothetical protein